MYPFKKGYYAVHNGWYVAAFRQDVSDQLVSRWILNQPVVLFRKQDGDVTCLSGLCPHRFFPLADSHLKDDTITCAYHGIAFDAEGQCTNIPGQDNIPSSCQLKKYPVVEHGMWVWVWPGDPTKADISLLPDLAHIGHDGEGITASPLYFYEVQARYQLLTDNLTDLSHLAYLHGSSIGSSGNAEVPEDLSEAPGVLYSSRTIRDCEAPPVVKEFHHYEGNINQVSAMNFYYPGLHAGSVEMTFPDDHERAGEAMRAMYIFHAITPATRHSCYYHFGLASKDVQQIENMRGYLQHVVQEDIDASQAIEHILQSGSAPSREVMKFSDQNSVRARMTLMKLMDKERGVTDTPVTVQSAEG